MQASGDTVLAIIPAYCEERFIGKVVRQVLQYVQTVLVVDDGSTDNTAAEAEAAGAKVIRHATNLGKGAALKT
ncbi:MAG: glycosyltransferase, partial [Verrucomicrobia bacterium]|nr:glycosyltransferase [Verrucomicrobiota bacterium]